MRPRLLALALLAATSAACLHPSAAPRTLAGGEASLAALPADFEILCWNVHKQRHRGFARELEDFAGEVELLALQEAVGAAPVWSRGLEDRSWSLVVAFEIGREHVAAGVASGSAVSPVRERALLSPTREPLTRTPKSILLSWIALAGGGDRLLLVNVHGLNFRPARALAEQLASLDAELEAHAGPVLVVGDFNTWSGARRAVVADFLARHDLRPAFTGEDAPRLDAVFFRGLELRAAEVLDSRSSDHDALRVRMSVPNSGSGPRGSR